MLSSASSSCSWYVGASYGGSPVRARFNAFPLELRSLVAYLQSVVTGRGRPPVGLNASSAYVTLAMLGLVVGLRVTCVMICQGNEGVKDLHELLAYAILAAVGAHLTGIVLHTIHHHESIALEHGLRSQEGAVRCGDFLITRTSGLGVLADHRGMCSRSRVGIGPPSRLDQRARIGHNFACGRSGERTWRGRHGSQGPSRGQRRGLSSVRGRPDQVLVLRRHYWPYCIAVCRVHDLRSAARRFGPKRVPYQHHCVVWL